VAIITTYTEYLNERLYFSTSLDNTIQYLLRKKNNKVAAFLVYIYSSHFYKDDEMINFVGLSKNDNMVDYSPTNRRPDDAAGRNWNVVFDNPQRVSMRVGRAVKRIYDTVKKSLSYEVSTNGRVYRDRYSGNYIFDFDINDNISQNNILVIPRGYLHLPETKVSATFEIKGHKISLTGACMSLYSYWNNFNTLAVAIDHKEDRRISPLIKSLEGIYDASRIDHEFDIPMDIKISNDFELTDVDIENFTNEFISFVKMNRSDETSLISEVRGEDIRFWYDKNNYCGGGDQPVGKLGNSCMSHEESQSYLDIYTDNSDKISMLILTNKNDKLVGRALLWKLDDGNIFMDRVYTASDSDDNIFINYAISKGYIYRAFSPVGGYVSYFKDSKPLSDFIASVTIKWTDYEYYPYVDTLKYLIGKVLTNSNHHQSENIKTLNDTEGGWEEQYNEDDDYDN